MIYERHGFDKLLWNYPGQIASMIPSKTVRDVVHRLRTCPPKSTVQSRAVRATFDDFPPLEYMHMYPALTCLHTNRTPHNLESSVKNSWVTWKFWTRLVVLLSLWSWITCANVTLKPNPLACLAGHRCTHASRSAPTCWNHSRSSQTTRLVSRDKVNPDHAIKLLSQFQRTPKI